MIPIIGYIIVSYACWRVLSKILESKDNAQTALGIIAIAAIAYFASSLALAQYNTSKDIAATSSIPAP